MSEPRIMKAPMSPYNGADCAAARKHTGNTNYGPLTQRDFDYLCGLVDERVRAVAVARDHAKKPPAICRGHEAEVIASIRDEERGERIASEIIAAAIEAGPT